jgi:hypothetical protein
MSTSPNNQNRLAFSSHCLPGSEAEQKEAERIAEFQRCKALRKAEAERAEPEVKAQREQEFLAAQQANKERMHRNRMPSQARNGYARPLFPAVPGGENSSGQD